MKPVAIFRHSASEGPGYFATYLEAHRLPYVLIKVDQGDSVPRSPDGLAGLVFMGGPMSVNDPLPWIRAECDLIGEAVKSDIPVLGHCLGGQLISKALGGVVTRNPVKEIGWGKVAVAGDAAARRWFGDLGEFLAFHWHGETFAIPSGAQALASSQYCARQAFALGPHLALQFHVEMTAELVQDWCREWDRELASLAARLASVQTPQEMQRNLEARLSQLQGVADRLYDRWVQNLKT